MRDNKKLRLWLRRLFWMGAGSVIAVALLMGVANLTVLEVSKAHCYVTVEEIPPQKAALVLGCARTLRGGYENRYFAERIRSAASLYEAGKVEYLIVSGDNRHKSYDEPTEMKRALIEGGVPAENIYCDYAGFRTLDSVVRVKEIFGQDSCIIVTQAFHAPRAVFLARSAGVNAVALYAGGEDSPTGYRTLQRERIARILAFLDVYVLHTEPKFYGPEVPLGPPQWLVNE